MLLHEEATRRKLRPDVQIFATDLDESALATAREGRYPRSIEASVSEERLARFFFDEGTHFRVRKELRDSVLFTSHSVIKEPPFIRLDLITCRNLLIYLERSLQQQVCSIFRYGLKPGGFLFLGSAETAEIVPDLFVPLDREAKIYRARPQAGHAFPVLPQFAIDLAAGVLTFGSLKKHRDGVYRSVPVPPSLLEALDMVHGIREQQTGRGRGRGVQLWPWNRMTGWRAVHDVMWPRGLKDRTRAPKACGTASGSPQSRPVSRSTWSRNG